ncbi:CLATHRIN ASSEMBLY PROTEIN [Salix viminalis]|uniref:CLATHRIN ASSEMBLY PROTEIN n=1 Tax=Salix viminalis TaxID=40686 RepID=A0A9Q0Z4Z7_SALVM|nr:CLATHRIN ASSEMBLY PROTEIN [Salix viminalis]
MPHSPPPLACSGHCLKIALFGQNYSRLIRSNGLLSLSIHVISKTTPLRILKLTPCLLGPTHNLLDQALDCFSLDNKATEEEVMHESLQHKIKQVSRELELFSRLQSLIDRVMDCIPTGVAPRSLTVQLAMKHIVRDSFICYTSFRREIVLVLDYLLGARLKGSVAHTTTSPSSWVELKSNSTEDDDQEKQVVKKNTLIEISSQMERCEENGHASNLELGKEEVAPLIHLEDGEDDNWEAALLEANSLNYSSHDHRMNFLIYPNSFSNGCGDGQGTGGEWKSWRILGREANPKFPGYTSQEGPWMQTRQDGIVAKHSPSLKPRSKSVSSQCEDLVGPNQPNKHTQIRSLLVEWTSC